MKGPRPLLRIVGLLDDAALIGLVVLQSHNQFLKSHKASGICEGDSQLAREGEEAIKRTNLSRYFPSSQIHII